MIIISISFVAFSLCAIFSLYKEKGNNKTHVFIWITILTVWGWLFIDALNKYLAVV